MADTEHIARLDQGLEAWNEWRVQNPGSIPDLSEANLGGRNLRGFDFTAANLTDAHLNLADASRANFDKAILTRATFRKANLTWSRFVAAVLDHADLREADLTRAILSQASLVLTDLSGAKLIEAALAATFFDRTVLTDAEFRESIIVSYFVRVDLSVVRDLEVAKHLGPSSIDIDTIFLSGGKIPESFLRFAGVPDTFIAFAKSLVANAIEFYSCFISYSTKGQDFADRLFADLQARAAAAGSLQGMPSAAASYMSRSMKLSACTRSYF